MAKNTSVNQSKYDKEIIDAIDPENKQGSIKNLIRCAIKKQG